MRRFLVACLFLLGFTLIEKGILSNIIFLKNIPDFIFLCSIYFSVQNGRLFGSLTGFTGGLFLDFLTPCPFGFNCLLRTILGYFFGFFNKTLNINGFLFPVLVGFVGTLIKFFLLKLICVFYPNISIQYSIISIEFLEEILFNSFFAPLVFRFLDLFKKSLVSEK